MHLTPEQRAEIVALQGEGCSIKEIGRRTGRALNTIRSVVRALPPPPTEDEIDRVLQLLHVIRRSPRLRAELASLVQAPL